jgi:hypothetical protein
MPQNFAEVWVQRVIQNLTTQNVAPRRYILCS